MEKDLGYRRVQSTGRGSYIISLPRDWIHETGIKKSSEIAFKKQDDLSLLLVPRKILEGNEEYGKPKLNEFWVTIDSKDDPQSISRKMISLYVVSADLIHVHFKDSGITSKFKTAINNLVKKKLLGSEIIDETSNEITIQILIDHPDFSLEKAIRRMAVLSLSANRDSLQALKSADHDLIDGIMETCDDVKRLNLYIIRQLKFGLERNQFRELGFKTPKEFLGYRIVTNDIKSIADDALNIVNNIQALWKMIDDQMLFLKESIDEEVYSQILNFNSSSHQLLEETMKAMFKRDYTYADKIIAKLDSFTTLENELIIVIATKKIDPRVSSIFRLALDSSRRIIEYCRDVAEVTLNRTVEDIVASQL